MLKFKGLFLSAVILIFACSFIFLKVNENENVVTMTNQLVYEPAEIEITVGETVTFKNTSYLVHTVTCDPEIATIKGSVLLPEGAKAFNSERIQAGDEFKHTFETKGTYRYFCIPHEGAKMRGEVIVK